MVGADRPDRARVRQEKRCRPPDESTILRFRHLLEAHGLVAQILATVNDPLTAEGLLLKSGSVVDARGGRRSGRWR